MYFQKKLAFSSFYMIQNSKYLYIKLLLQSESVAIPYYITKTYEL